MMCFCGFWILKRQIESDRLRIARNLKTLTNTGGVVVQERRKPCDLQPAVRPFQSTVEDMKESRLRVPVDKMKVVKDDESVRLLVSVLFFAQKKNRHQ